MRRDRVLGHAGERRLGLVAVDDQAGAQHRRDAGHVGESRGDQPAGAGLGCRDAFSGCRSAGNDIFGELIGLMIRHRMTVTAA